jgi:hypothetical protein
MNGGEGSDDPEYDVDFRERPEEYEIGRGEEGVFKLQPYKDELLPLWTFVDREAAAQSAQQIYGKYEEYRERGEFPGMDMARKYLQMGYTRAMRYAKYPGGTKYVDGEERDPEEWADREKREAALVFERYLERVRSDEVYQRARESHRERE